MRVIWLFLIVLFALAAACAPSTAAVPSEPQEPPAQETSAPETPISAASPSQGDATEMIPITPGAAGMENLVERAKEDLAQRLNIALTQIDLIEAKAVVWPDASLGCPQPGMLYKQVPEDGALILLQANGISYEYHNGGSRGLFLCEQSPQKETPPPQLHLSDFTPRAPGSPDPDAPTPDNSIPPIKE
jgi:hypothetical protein